MSSFINNIMKNIVWIFFLIKKIIIHSQFSLLLLFFFSSSFNCDLRELMLKLLYNVAFSFCSFFLILIFNYCAIVVFVTGFSYHFFFSSPALLFLWLYFYTPVSTLMLFGKFLRGMCTIGRSFVCLFVCVRRHCMHSIHVCLIRDFFVCFECAVIAFS